VAFAYYGAADHIDRLDGLANHLRRSVDEYNTTAVVVACVRLTRVLQNDSCHFDDEKVGGEQMLHICHQCC
jgi:hypothetical protein